MLESKDEHINPHGFREYDARWLYKKDINQAGIECLGKGLGSQIIKHTKKNNPRGNKIGSRIARSRTLLTTSSLCQAVLL